MNGFDLTKLEQVEQDDILLLDDDTPANLGSIANLARMITDEDEDKALSTEEIIIYSSFECDNNDESIEPLTHEMSGKEVFTAYPHHFDCKCLEWRNDQVIEGAWDVIKIFHEVMINTGRFDAPKELTKMFTQLCSFIEKAIEKHSDKSPIHPFPDFSSTSFDSIRLHIVALRQFKAKVDKLISSQEAAYELQMFVKPKMGFDLSLSVKGIKKSVKIWVTYAGNNIFVIDEVRGDCFYDEPVLYKKLICLKLQRMEISGHFIRMFKLPPSWAIPGKEKFRFYNPF